MRSKEQVQKELDQLRSRLQLYLAKEAEMLTGEQSYSIGPMNLARYNTALSDIRNTIKALKEEIAELESLLQGGGRRKAVGAVPMNW